MKKYMAVLKQTRIFQEIGEEEIETMLECLGAVVHPYRKGEYVIRTGETIRRFMILMEGSLHIQKDDFWGNRFIISRIAVGEMFGEAYAVPDGGAIPNDVIAVCDSAVMFFDMQRFFTVCSSACRFHTLTIQNLFHAISEKNRKLTAKLGYMSKRTTREKLLAYLSDEAGRQNRSVFEIPYNRQQLADYLSVDRSAMSNELCKMRDEGLLLFEKNRFTLL